MIESIELIGGEDQPIESKVIRVNYKAKVPNPLVTDFSTIEAKIKKCDEELIEKEEKKKNITKHIDGEKYFLNAGRNALIDVLQNISDDNSNDYKIPSDLKKNTL